MLGVASNLTFFTTLALGVASVVVVRGPRSARHPGRTFLVLVALSLAAAPLAFFGDVRFHVPVVPFLILGAAALGVQVNDRVRARSASGGSEG